MFFLVAACGCFCFFGWLALGFCVWEHRDNTGVYFGYFLNVVWSFSYSLEVEGCNLHLGRKISSREAVEECKTQTSRFLSKDSSVLGNLVMHKTRLTIVCVWSKLRSTDPWWVSRTDLGNADTLSEVSDSSKLRNNSCSLLLWQLETRCLGSRPHKGIITKLLLCLVFLSGGVCCWLFPRKIFVCLQQTVWTLWVPLSRILKVGAEEYEAKARSALQYSLV